MNSVFRSLAAAASLLIAAPGIAQAQTELRVGTIIPEDSAQGRGVNAFAKAFNEAQDDYTIIVFHGAQLGDGPTEVKAVQQGIQDGFIEDFAYYLPYSDDLRIANAPYIFDDRAHLLRWLGTDKFAELVTEVEEKGKQHIILGNVLWNRGPYRVMMATKPVLTLENLATTKLRLWSSEVITRYYGKGGLGANTVNIPWTETYLALSQGTADAVTAPLELVGPMKFGEVAKHMMLIDEFPQVLTVSIASRHWDEMSEATRNALVEAWDHGAEVYNAEVAEAKDSYLEDAKALGVTIHEFDRAPFVARAAEITKQLADEGYWSPSLIASIKATSNK